eukprot:gene25307-biopygen10499
MLGGNAALPPREGTQVHMISHGAGLLKDTRPTRHHTMQHGAAWSRGCVAGCCTLRAVQHRRGTNGDRGCCGEAGAGDPNAGGPRPSLSATSATGYNFVHIRLSSRVDGFITVLVYYMQGVVPAPHHSASYGVVLLFNKDLRSYVTPGYLSLLRRVPSDIAQRPLDICHCYGGALLTSPGGIWTK